MTNQHHNVEAVAQIQTCRVGINLLTERSHYRCGWLSAVREAQRALRVAWNPDRISGLLARVASAPHSDRDCARRADFRIVRTTHVRDPEGTRLSALRFHLRRQLPPASAA